MRSVLQVRSTHGYAENETQKPIGIIAPLIAYGCPLGGTVFDPFMGAGSVLVAAKLAGCRAIGVDVREDQCEIAARRCSQEVLGLVG
jgi:site-specific DNA-methyltransferase (adenine-specific)